MIYKDLLFRGGWSLFRLLRNVSSKALNMVSIFVSKGQGLRPFTAHTYLSELCYTTLYTIAMQHIFKSTRVITFCLDTLREVSLPAQERPSPANSSLQVQLCPPTVLVQFAFTPQLWLPVMHSSISRLGSND